MHYSWAQTRKKLLTLLTYSGSDFNSRQRTKLDKKQLSSFEQLTCRFHGQISNRIVLALPTTGCSLFRRPQGGCLHCGLFANGIVQEHIHPNAMVDQFARKLERLDFTNFPVLCLYTPGSFLDSRELNTRTRKKILSLAAGKKGIKKIIFESVPQHITRKKIEDLLTFRPSMEIEIAVGLDTRNDRIRSICIQKNFSLKIFEKACRLLNHNGISWSAFALLKPPFLTEQEAINDTIQTVRYIYEAGAKAVSIEPMAIQEHTFAWMLFRKNLYRPPWLWSLLEVIKNLPPGFEVRIGGQVVYPKSIRSAYNCDICTREIKQKIQEFNTVQDRNIFANLDCDCRNKWADELQMASIPLLRRINIILQDFDETSPG